jgi:hypothetical protein
MVGRVLISLMFLAALAPSALAQSDDSAVPLGDLARTLRTTDSPSQHAVIDNDNLTQVMDDAQAKPVDGTPVFSINGATNKFQMSSPDGDCSLSFNANNTALISDPIITKDVPLSELAKLDGPATVNSDTLEVSIYNGTGWNLTELTVGLTMIRHVNPDEPEMASTATAALVPASLKPRTMHTAVITNDEPSEGSASETSVKRSDTTVLYHLKGLAAPLKTTTFREIMSSAIEPGVEWHWAIVQAKGIPPKIGKPNATAATLPVLSAVPSDSETVPLDSPKP